MTVLISSYIGTTLFKLELLTFQMKEMTIKEFSQEHFIGNKQDINTIQNIMSKISLKLMKLWNGSCSIAFKVHHICKYSKKAESVGFRVNK